MDSEALSYSKELTSSMRMGDDLRWHRLREALMREGIGPRDAAIGDLYRDDPAGDYGIVVARDGRAFEFVLQIVQGKDGQWDPRESYVSEWARIDNSDVAIREEYAIALGQRVLDLEAPD